MAIAFDAATDGGENGGGATTLTFSHTCTGTDRQLFVGFVGDTVPGNDDVVSVTYGVTACTFIGKLANANDRYVYLYHRTNPASGANNVVITCTNAHYIIGGATSYTGVAQTGQPDASATNFGTTASLATSVTTIADNCWTVLMHGSNGSAGVPTAGAGSTLRVLGTFNAWALFDSNAAKTPAGSTSMTTTVTSGSFELSHIMASFAPGVDAVSNDARIVIRGVG